MTAAISWLPSGTVYGTLLNFRREFEVWAPRMGEPPYKAPPRAPVLYVKTANTFAPCGAAIAVPEAAEVGATLGLVIGEAEGARGAGGHALVLLNDLSLPHESYYRPALRFRNRDGFLVCGPAIRRMTDVGDLEQLVLDVSVNGLHVQRVELATLVRDAKTLLEDVSEFMTLRPGDVLMLGTDCLEGGLRPRVQAGDRIEIAAPGFAPLTHTVTEETV